MKILKLIHEETMTLKHPNLRDKCKYILIIYHVSFFILRYKYVAEIIFKSIFLSPTS